MKLHRLVVSGFGPYAGREEVDFDLLGADGLFLLHGDTGAGKTTLLDAVAFALFGRVPGARNDVKRLRCDYADRDTRTVVELELTVRGRRFRLVRSPEYERPKKRGDGFTRQQAQVSLTWLAGWSGEGHTRIDEVAREVESLLGMTADQFFQVVLLPQGEFARFLRADTGEREKVLEKLFGTDRFQAVENWFVERRKERGRAVKALAQEARELGVRLAETAGEEPPEDSGDEEWLSSVLKRLVEERDAAGLWARQVAAARGSAQKAWQEARVAAERSARVRAASATVARCDEQEPQRLEWVRERNVARRALAVVPAYEVERRFARDLERTRASEAAAAVIGYEGTDPRADGERYREVAGGLAALAEEADRQRADRERVERLTARLTGLSGQLAVVVRALDEAPDRVTAAQALVEESVVAQARSAETTARAQAARELPDALERGRQVDEERRAAVDAHQLARDRWQAVRARRLEQMAVELAEALRPDEACPVCGSAQHPAPAQPVLDAVTAADEEAAAGREQRAQERRTAVERAAQQAEARVAALREVVGDREVEDILAEHREVETLARQRAERENSLRVLEQRVAELVRQRSEGEREVARTTEQRDGLIEVVRERQSRLEAARDGFPDVVARRDHLIGQAEALSTWDQRRTEAAESAVRLAEQRVAVAEAAAAAGFADVADALSAARTPDALAGIERRVREIEDARIAAQAVLDELADVSPETEVDVSGAEQRFHEATAGAEKAAENLAVATGKVERTERLATHLREVWTRLEPVAAEFEELDALTDAINGRGQNTRAMTLRTYVLAARLEEVAMAASTRLEHMSHGRYRFVHSVEPGKYGTRGGLGLDVLDDYSGRRRPAKTLSGGESFLASLALALGLSDVVSAGAVLDTLFIDEGFGTLDAETLDLVMTTLDDLRAGGRVVGLVSHVEELRQRIPTRLRVTKSRTGSTLNLTA
ncbi:SMC family ATPase [Saccharothrix violaceirubra]|uniref:Nuclease SbcCD subunit C n=1 Tax=Saccharothrix violaceirubra TaxID=413306 RepID=A0A7W7T9H3_9PSEU|nr:SMC family ATPase [Saccharothrix violaceirubra]MBB4968457.1 exonuclease SbcC [Saccharothrix violaceirubra]